MRRRLIAGFASCRSGCKCSRWPFSEETKPQGKTSAPPCCPHSPSQGLNPQRARACLARLGAGRGGLIRAHSLLLSRSFTHTPHSIPSLACLLEKRPARGVRGVRAVPAPCCGRGKGPRDSLVPAWRSCGLGDPSAESAHTRGKGPCDVRCAPSACHGTPETESPSWAAGMRAGVLTTGLSADSGRGLGTAPHSAVLWPRHTGR